jgi:hypothetical protein
MFNLTFFHQKSNCGATLPTSPFCSVLLLLQTTGAWEKSRWDVVRSLV